MMNLPTIGQQELLVIAVIALLLFGRRLPEAVRRLDDGVTGLGERLAGAYSPETVVAFVIGLAVIFLQMLILARLVGLR